MVIVELVGPPGAGKTTLLPTILASLQEHGLVAYTVVEAARPVTARTIAGRLLQYLSPAPLRDPLLWRLFLLFSFLYRLRFMAKHPQLVWSILRWQRRRPPASRARQRRVTFWLLRLMGYHEFLCAKLQPNEALVLDEGFLHRVVQLFSSDVEKPDGGSIRRYTKMIPAPDLVVFVYAPPKICHARIYERGLWDAFRGKEAAEVMRFVDNAYQATMLALKFSRAQGWPIVEIDNGGGPPVQAQTALQRELSLLVIGDAARFDLEAA